MRARWLGSDIVTRETLPEPGDVGIGADNYHFNLLVRCPVCHGLHPVPIPCSTGDREPWEFNVATITLAPSVRVAGNRGVCHWTLTNGVFTIHSESTARPDA